MKTDSNLGKLVNNHLIKIGVETPIVKTSLTNDQKVSEIQKSMKYVMEVLGLDLTDDSLIDTPKRVADMYVNEIFVGLDYNNFPKATTVENKMKYDEMITVRDITSMSVCEHHLVTIDGVANVSYIPKDKVLGLSKINRIVEFFSKRPQIQERLTMQIGHALMFILETDDVAVTIDATHYCVKSRGVQDTNSHTTTSFINGAFRDDSAVRQEFYANIR